MKKPEIHLTFFQGLANTLVLLVVVLFFMPFYLAVSYSFKTNQEIASNPLSLPKTLSFFNFAKAIEVSDYFHGFRNSIIVTVCTVFISIIVCSMAGYIIARTKNRWYSFVSQLFVASVFIPFQIIMFPLYRMLKVTHLLNTLPSLVLVLTGMQIGLNVFLYVGYIKSIPPSLEEAAFIDGSSRFRTFWQIIFPLIKPITMTVAVLTVLGAWNDFIVSVIIAQKAVVRTLPLMQYYFIGQYNLEINLAFAFAVLTIIPIMLFYFMVQKYIVDGFTVGSVKG